MVHVREEVNWSRVRSQGAETLGRGCGELREFRRCELANRGHIRISYRAKIPALRISDMASGLIHVRCEERLRW